MIILQYAWVKHFFSSVFFSGALSVLESSEPRSFEELTRSGGNLRSDFPLRLVRYALRARYALR